MTSYLTNLVKSTLKSYGDGAAEHFGVKPGALQGYIKKGRYPLQLVEKILAEQMDSGNPEMIAGGIMSAPRPLVEEPPQPAPPPPPRSAPAPTPPDKAPRLEDVVRYIQGTVDVYMRQFAARIATLERQHAALNAAQLRIAGMPNLARPDQNVPVEQVFTTNPNAGLGIVGGHALDTGIAPTREMVDAQANMTVIEGVPVPGGELARPAEYIPNQPAFGFGWNIPRPRK